MDRIASCVAAALLAFGTTARAATFSFVSDPFAGTDALTTPGRQVVGGEPFISFSILSDVFALETEAFGVGDQVLFANDLVENLPPADLNVIVLRTTDNDGDPGTPFGAGNAANLIADQVTSPGPGFFVYFNSGLDLPRLVYSTDLSDNTADLKILARMTNLVGQSEALATFTAANFTIVPEPAPPLLLAVSAVLLGWRWRRSAGPGSSSAALPASGGLPTIPG
jgi:hypothetical protein